MPLQKRRPVGPSGKVPLPPVHVGVPQFRKKPVKGAARTNLKPFNHISVNPSVVAGKLQYAAGRKPLGAYIRPATKKKK